jgi:hypothetical protein
MRLEVMKVISIVAIGAIVAPGNCAEVTAQVCGIFNGGGISYKLWSVHGLLPSLLFPLSHSPLFHFNELKG